MRKTRPGPHPRFPLDADAHRFRTSPRPSPPLVDLHLTRSSVLWMLRVLAVVALGVAFAVLVGSWRADAERMRLLRSHPRLVVPTDVNGDGAIDVVAGSAREGVALFEARELDGTLLWSAKHEVGDITLRQSLHAVQGETLVLGASSNGRSLQALAVDLRDGSLRWQVAVAGTYWWSGGVVADAPGQVLALTEPDHVVLLDLADGEERWSRALPDPSWLPGAPVVHGEWVLVPGLERTWVTLVDGARQGVVSGWGRRELLVHDGRVCGTSRVAPGLGCWSGDEALVEPWPVPVVSQGAEPLSVDLDAGVALSERYSRVTKASAVTAVSTETGEVLWTEQVGGLIERTGCAGVFYAHSDARRTLLWVESGGAALRKRKLQHSVRCLAVHDGAALLEYGGSTLASLDLASGEVRAAGWARWHLPWDTEHAAVVGGTLYLADRGEVATVDVATLVARSSDGSEVLTPVDPASLVEPRASNPE